MGLSKGENTLQLSPKFYFRCGKNILSLSLLFKMRGEDATQKKFSLIFLHPESHNQGAVMLP